MADFQPQLSTLVDQFVAQVTTVARETAMQTLQAALGAANDVVARLRPGTVTTSNLRSVTSATQPSASRAPVTRTAGARAKGEKRPSNEIESVRTRLLEFIERNPGLRVEQINAKLGTTTRDVALPLRKLIGEGVIRSEGEKRSTQYFPAARRRAPAAPVVAPVRRRRG